jgi:hypothetical protein
MLPIPGTLSLDHLKQNLAALDLQLSDDELDAPASVLAMRLLRAVVTGLVLLVGLATLLGLLDRVSWVFELADVFRLQYLALLVGAALAALALRRPRLALVAAALALVNVAVLGIPLTPNATASNEHIPGIAASRRREHRGGEHRLCRGRTPRSQDPSGRLRRDRADAGNGAAPCP